MFTFAAIDAANLLAIVIGLMGLGSVIFAALRFNRDDTTSIVNQQDTILNDMKTVNEELRLTVIDLRTERDALRHEVQELRDAR